MYHAPRLVTGTGEAPSVAGGCAIYYVTYCALLLVSTIHNTEKASSSGAMPGPRTGTPEAAPYTPPASWVGRYTQN